MVIDFAEYVAAQKAREAAVLAEIEAEARRRERLELILTDLLADLEAA